MVFIVLVSSIKLVNKRSSLIEVKGKFYRGTSIGSKLKLHHIIERVNFKRDDFLHVFIPDDSESGKGRQGTLQLDPSQIKLIMDKAVEATTM
jgi:hypothetical protein